MAIWQQVSARMQKAYREALIARDNFLDRAPSRLTGLLAQSTGDPASKKTFCTECLRIAEKFSLPEEGDDLDKALFELLSRLRTVKPNTPLSEWYAAYQEYAGCDKLLRDCLDLEWCLREYKSGTISSILIEVRLLAIRIVGVNGSYPTNNPYYRWIQSNKETYTELMLEMVRKQEAAEVIQRCIEEDAGEQISGQEVAWLREFLAKA